MISQRKVSVNDVTQVARDQPVARRIIAWMHGLSDRLCHEEDRGAMPPAVAAWVGEEVYLGQVVHGNHQARLFAELASCRIFGSFAYVDVTARS